MLGIQSITLRHQWHDEVIKVFLTSKDHNNSLPPSSKLVSYGVYEG